MADISKNHGLSFATDAKVASKNLNEVIVK